MTDPSAKTPTARRRRRTLRLDSQTFCSLLERAEQLEARRHECGNAFTNGGCAAAQVSGVFRDPLQALLKAFTDAANVRGGLRLDGQGRPDGLASLIERGRENARAGETMPKLLKKVRSGQVVDLRTAQGALHFFRLVLDRPTLTLDQIGAVETQRLLALREAQAALHRVRDRLPQDVLQSLFLRAEEAAGHASAQDRARVHYSGFEPFVDQRGVQRLRVRRVYSYRPIRLSQYPGVVSTAAALEWYEWNRLQDSSLVITVLDENGRPERELRPPLRKRLDEERGVVVLEASPQALASLQPLLQLPDASQHRHSHEVRWEQTFVFNRADRDIVVSYQPVNTLHIGYTPSPHLPGLAFSVGDSPGLRRTADGWLLDRTLLPREVLAVRFRDPTLDASQAQQLSPSGEWYGDLTRRS